MGLFDGLNPLRKASIGPSEDKSSRSMAAVLSMVMPKSPIYTDYNYLKFAEEGYCGNVYVFTAIRAISMSIAGIPLLVYQETEEQTQQNIGASMKRMFAGQKDMGLPGPGNDMLGAIAGDEATGDPMMGVDSPEQVGPGTGTVVNELDNHPLLDLLDRPNPRQSGRAFLMNMVTDLMYTGNCYIERVGNPRKAPEELYCLRPDRVQVIPGDTTNPVLGYVYTVNGVQVFYPYDMVLHIRMYNPMNDWYGMSPMRAAMHSVDQNNESRNWNVSLLQNMCRPPGALVAPGPLDPNEYDRMKQMIKTKYSGVKNAGTPILLEDGLKFETMGINPVDMAWAEGMRLSAREISIAFGVPPEMMGDGSQKTYSNYKESRMAFYMETVLPLFDYILAEFNHWLCAMYPGKIYLDYNEDEIKALQEDADAKHKRARDDFAADLITKNEARLSIDYETDPNGDVYFSDLSKGAMGNPADPFGMGGQQGGQAGDLFGQISGAAGQPSAPAQGGVPQGAASGGDLLGKISGSIGAPQNAAPSGDLLNSISGAKHYHMERKTLLFMTKSGAKRRRAIVRVWS